MKLSDEAYERLKTIGEHTELGSGFKIAMRDLEIRGAGNILGGDQSGHIAAVGYDLYSQMVIEAVGEDTRGVPPAASEDEDELPVGGGDLGAGLPRAEEAGGRARGEQLPARGAEDGRRGAPEHVDPQ